MNWEDPDCNGLSFPVNNSGIGASLTGINIKDFVKAFDGIPSECLKMAASIWNCGYCQFVKQNFCIPFSYL